MKSLSIPVRTGCIRCVLKHLASAVVLAREILNGNDDFEHRFHLEGHLAEAEQEIIAINGTFAALLRSMRRATFDTDEGFSFPARRLIALEQVAKQIDRLEKRGFFRATAVPGECCGGGSEVPAAGGVPDVLFPLSTAGSRVDFDELRFALRSIAANLSGFGKIRIVCDRRIDEFFTGVEWTLHSNDRPRKQMNIHLALVEAMKQEGVPERLIFWADDNVVLQKMDARRLPLVGRSDDLSGYLGKNSPRFWHQSLAQTAEMLQKRGLPTVNFEAHTPMELRKSDYLRVAGEYNYFTGVGPCYLSLYANTLKLRPTKNSRDVKATFENDKKPVAALPEAAFIGYNDAGVRAGVLAKLLERFPEPCRYEKFPEEQLIGDAVTAGVVIGTCPGSAAYLELQLAAFRKFHTAPVLVVCDGPGDDAMAAVAQKFFCVEYLTLPQKFGHMAGDLAIYAAGLRWAARRGFDIVVKLSRRFIPLVEWLPGLAARAIATDAPALTSYDVDCDRYVFRSECAALHVKAWQEVLPEIDRLAVPGKFTFVEKWFAARSLEVAHRHLTPTFCRTRIAEGNAPEQYGYAVWKDLLGDGRKRIPEGVLWHDVHTAQDYAAAAAQFGLSLQRFS